MLPNIVFQLILDEVYAYCEHLNARHLSLFGVEWSLGHFEYDGLSLCILSLIRQSDQFLQRLKIIFLQYALEITFDKMVYLDQKSLHQIHDH